MIKNVDTIEQYLEDVRQLMASTISKTVLKELTEDCGQLLASGKMLRSCLVYRVGSATQLPRNTLLSIAAAIELIHAASLLHDDVIDGGYLRRSAPTFWVERGVSAAILVGDLLLFKAVELIGDVDHGRLTPYLVQLTGEVCNAEAEQELLLRQKKPTWENCVRIARHKTGALFAFAAYACGGQDESLSKMLLEAGYLAGTAYQLTDDILDANGSENVCGKTLGSDLARAKTTAATVESVTHQDAIRFIEKLCSDSEKSLEHWPVIQAAWNQYLTLDMRPALSKNVVFSS